MAAAVGRGADPGAPVAVPVDRGTRPAPLRHGLDFGIGLSIDFGIDRFGLHLRR
ncbi:hypothetical protein [Streptomyces sp. NBC_00448]|uniref:hypothetical protein n=1 Tax=Streptomyces sp. NBC_00448 TaxID=2903652 RepID=UPI002E2453BA